MIIRTNIQYISILEKNTDSIRNELIARIVTRFIFTDYPSVLKTMKYIKGKQFAFNTIDKMICRNHVFTLFCNYRIIVYKSFDIKQNIRQLGCHVNTNQLFIS